MAALEDAVDLVLFAWEHGENGDLFVQKAPAATIETLAKAVLELAKEGGRFKSLPEIKVIGTYDKYFIEGKMIASELQTYNSHNTERLDVEGMKKLFLKLPLIHKEFGV